MSQFLVLEWWVIFAFACFFWVLFREEYARPLWESEPDLFEQPSNCINVDKRFEDLSYVVTYLWEATLLGDVNIGCFHVSSGGWLPVLFMYSFVLVSTIMFMNMLIAMMAESFGRVYQNKQEFFLFDKVRRVQTPPLCKPQSSRVDPCNPFALTFKHHLNSQ